MNKTIQIKCSCLELIVDPTISNMVTVTTFKSEQDAIKAWEFHKKQQKLEYPNSTLALCVEASLIITETKNIRS